MRHPIAIIARSAALAVLCAACFWSEAAHAQSSADIQRLNARIDDLEAQLGNLRADSYASGGVSGGASSGGRSVESQVFLRLDRLEAEMRRLTGEVEQLGHRMTQLEEDQRRRFEDMEFRLLELEGIDPTSIQGAASIPATGGAAAAAGAAAGAGSAPALAPGSGVLGEIPTEGGAAGNMAATGDDEAAYQAALAQLQRGDSDGAERAFRSFLVDYQDSQRGGEARFWMGEISYARSEYQQAARLYLDVQQNYPDDRKAPDSLLKLGMSLARMGQTREACLTLQEVPIQYPEAGPSVLRGAEIEGRRLNCGF
jgi:tol-pal system protein YbgF